MAAMTVAPPQDGMHPRVTVNGRAYECEAGFTIVVPDFDAIVMIANGWTVMPTAVVGIAAVSTGAQLALDPSTGDVFTTSTDGS